MTRYSIWKGQAQEPTHEKLAISAMLYWSAASHSWSFKRSLSTCASHAVIYSVLGMVKGLRSEIQTSLLAAVWDRPE